MESWSTYSDITPPEPPKKVAKEGKSPNFRIIQVGEILFDIIWPDGGSQAYRVGPKPVISTKWAPTCPYYIGINEVK